VKNFGLVMGKPKHSSIFFLSKYICQFHIYFVSIKIDVTFKITIEFMIDYY
jgi:hypothetical protein